MPISIGGQTYNDDQIKSFYAGGGNDAQFLQQQGITDQSKIHDLAVQARSIGGAPTGEAAVQQNFQRYQQYNPSGANANNYQAWVAGQNGHTLSAMRAGTYTGASLSPADYEPGGIYGPGSAGYGQAGYASGLGSRGDGNGWGDPGASSGGAGGYGGGYGGGGGSGGGGGGGGNLGFSSSSTSSGGLNPYLMAQADDIGRRSNQALGANLQGIRSNSVATGGLGGSRQGVAEGTAIASANDTLQGNLANLYGTDYTNQQNRNLQAYGIDSGAATSRYGVDSSAATSRYGVDSSAATSRYGIDTNAALTNQSQMQNFYTQNRQLDQSGMALGANLYTQGNAGLTGQGQGVYNIGNTQQQAPWSVINSGNAGISPYTGYGATNTQTGTTGGGAQGMVGGALAGAQIGKNLGLGGTSSSGWNFPSNNDTTIPMQPGGGY